MKLNDNLLDELVKIMLVLIFIVLIIVGLILAEFVTQYDYKEDHQSKSFSGFTNFLEEDLLFEQVLDQNNKKDK